MNDEDYVKEIERQLKDESTYTRSINNPLPKVISELNYKLTLAEEADLISKKELKYLNTFKILALYTISKIHKNAKKTPEDQLF